MKYVYFILLAAIPAVLCSQTIEGNVASSKMPRLLIKSDLAQLLYVKKPSINLGLDFRCVYALRMDMSFGWVLGSDYFSNHEGETYRGPRLRFGGKYAWMLLEDTYFHLGLEGRYDRVTNREWANVSRQGQQYEEIFLRNRQVESVGASFKVGLQLFLGKSRRWVLEPDIKLGLTRHDVWYQDPPDVELVRERVRFFDFRFPEGRSYRFNPAIAIHFGYVLIR